MGAHRFFGDFGQANAFDLGSRTGEIVINKRGVQPLLQISAHHNKIGKWKYPSAITFNRTLANGFDVGVFSFFDITFAGKYAWRVRGEEHMWTPDTVAKLQNATRTNNAATYKEYAKLIK